MSWKLVAWVYGIAFLAATAWGILWCVAYVAHYISWDAAA
jgi:hypothetical protein